MDSYKRFYQIFKEEPLVSRKQGNGKIPVVELGKKPCPSFEFDKLEYRDIGTVMIDKMTKDAYLLGVEELRPVVSCVQTSYPTFGESRILFQMTVPMGVQYLFVPLKDVDILPHVYGKICDSDGLVAQGSITISVLGPDSTWTGTRHKFVALGCYIARLNMASPDDEQEMLFFDGRERCVEGDIIRCYIEGAVDIVPEKSSVIMSVISLKRIGPARRISDEEQ